MKFIYADAWKDKEDKWLDYVKKDVSSTSSVYARCSKSMHEITGSGLKDCLTLPGLGWKFLNSLKTEEA